jgi:FMN phosphatase YigB (HAD superfamily)
LKLSSLFFDVDDVMLDMDRIAHLGVQAVLTPLAAELGEEAARAVRESFAAGYAILIKQLRSGGGIVHADYAELKQQIARWQRGVTEAGYELKMFSRHSLLAIALEKHGHPVTERLVHGALDRYWQVLADATEVFPDAKMVIDRLLAEGTPFLLATNSDGFLELDERAQTFRYDAPGAVRKKLARLSALRAIGIADAQISIGDPIGKPDPRFYEAVLEDFERFYGKKADLSRALAIGDSLTSDVLPMMKLGVPYGAWVQRSRTGAPAFLNEHPQVAAIRELTEIWSVPWAG